MRHDKDKRQNAGQSRHRNKYKKSTREYKKKTRCRRIFRTRPDRAWGPPSRDVVLTRHSYLAPRLKKSTPIPPLPLWAFTVCSRDSLTINKGCSQQDSVNVEYLFVVPVWNLINVLSTDYTYLRMHSFIRTSII